MLRANKRVIGLLFIAAAALAVLVVLLVPPAETERIYAHMSIHGVDVGGMTEEEADAALQARFAPELTALTLRFALEGEVLNAKGFDNFGARFDFTQAIADAQDYGNSRNLRRRITRLLGNPHEITTLPIFHFDAKSVETAIRDIALKIRRDPVNARFSYENNTIVVIPGKMGRALDIAQTLEAATAALTQLTDATVEVTVQSLRPRYIRADLDFAVSTLGTYSTPAAGDDARTRNIKRAAARIHNQYLLPGEVFSAGQTIGAYLPDSGYEAALVLVQGEPVQDKGGGVCQVATTLYNAVLRAELTVVQRHNHSARVGYTDYGFDATLAGTWYDLKFMNSTNQPLLITARVQGGKLHVSLHGFEARPPERRIRFVNERTATTPPEACKEIPDDTLAPGERVQMLEAVPGYTYEVFKHVYMHGNKIERIRVNTSTYRPLQGVVHVGP